MSSTKPPRSMSLRDPFPDSDKSMEGAGSWDSLDWLKLEEQPSLSRSASVHANYKCLLESEHVVVEGRGVVLVNTDEAGTLVVTNFRVIFMSDGTENIIALGTIPLATIEKFYKTGLKNQQNARQADKAPTRRLLYIVGKDMRIIVFAFRPRTKQRRVVYDALLRCTKPLRLWDLYAFSSGPSRFANSDPRTRLLNEYFRLLGYGWRRASSDMLERDLFTLSNERWRISNINSDYSMCASYPFALIFPKSISDQEIIQASSFRSRCRLPVVSWCHPETGAVIARSSQPLVGLMMNMRSNADEKLVAALCANGESKERRKLYIVDARPRKNALANGAMGGGSESSSNYFQSEVVFLGIDNIHAMRDSLLRLRDYLDTHGTTSSDGISSFLRHGGWTWGGGNLSSMSASVSTLGDTNWLIHIQSVLAGSAWIAARVALESSSVLVHCSDGWDRTTQLISLANLLLDPFYRTFSGFQALVEKDWLAFGHPFADRVGIPTVSGAVSLPQDMARQSSTGSFPSSPLRQSASSLPPQPTNPAHAQNNYSPIFLQWVDCISQLLRVYPFAFEFSSAFLVDLVDCVLSCRFGNFFCNSEKERQQVGVSEACGCMWRYLEDMRTGQGKSHPHYNLFYDPLKHNTPLLPPAAALAPTLWPQFHLRWSCPAEAQAGDIEAKCRIMSLTFHDLQMAKEAAEKKAKETSNALETLSADLRNEKQVSSSAMAMVKKASKESAAIKRAIQSLGCRVNLTTNGDTSLEVASRRPLEDKPDLCVSVSMSDDGEDDGPVAWVCESLCPMRSRDGGCRWPEAGCAQVSSQFVGLRANFDAFETLSIYDGYFDSK